MKKHSITYSFFITLAFLFTQAVSAQNLATDEEVYSYLSLSGASKALQGIPAQIQGMGQQMQLTVKDPEQSQKVMAIIAASWQQDVIEQQVFDYVKANISAEQMKQLLVWLKGDLATRVKLAEEKASEPSFNQELMRYMADIQSNPPAPSRIAAVRKFIEETDMIDNTMEMVMDISQGLMHSFQTIMPNEAEPVDIEAQLSQMEMMIKPMLEQQMIMSSYYIYDGISDADLAEYTAFYQQDLGQKEIEVMYGALGHAMNVWAQSMGKDLAADIEKNKAAE